jgi:hypothetical protein
MRRVLLALVALVCLQSVFSFQSQSFTSTSNFGQQWKKTNRATQQTELCFHVALRHNGASALDQKFWKVTDSNTATIIISQ